MECTSGEKCSMMRKSDVYRTGVWVSKAKASEGDSPAYLQRTRANVGLSLCNLIKCHYCIISASAPERSILRA